MSRDRRKTPEKLVQICVAIDENTRERLKAAAQHSLRSLSAEAFKRLRDSLKDKSAAA